MVEGKRISIKQKLILSSLISTSILIPLAIIVFGANAKKASYAELSSNIKSIEKKVLELRKLEKDYIIKDVNNQTYHKTKRSHFTTTFDSVAIEITNDVDSLLNNELLVELEYRKDLESMKVMLEDYIFQFESLQDLVLKKGVENYGITGKLRKAVKQVEKESKLPGVEMWRIKELRKNEKDFIIRGDLKYQKKLHKNAHIVKTQIQASPSIDDSTKKASIEAISVYERTFDVLIDSYKTIGLDEKSGLKGKMERTTARINPMVHTLVEGISIQSKSLSKTSSMWIIICFVLAFGISFFLSFFSGSRLSKPIVSLDKVIGVLSTGNLPDFKPLKTGDEIEQMSHGIANLVENLTNVKNFSLEVGKGNFNTEITVFNNEGDLGESLSQMKDSLKNVAEAEARRNWSVEGLTKFADILRKNNDNVNLLGDNILSNLVKYVNANQAGLFILNNDDENDPYLEMIASHAYDRKKNLQKEIRKGQGLVGTSWGEGKKIVLNQVPENYINIESGLGDAPPTFIIIIPLIVNDEVYGALELASFKPKEDFEIEFLETLSESVASTLATVKINATTAALLEESKIIQEELKNQEEELRQNMEEMRATQETMEHKTKSDQKKIKDLEKQIEELKKNQE